MHSKIRYAAYSLVGISIVLTLLLGYPDVNRSRAKARAVVPPADLRAGTTAMEEGSATLSPANLNISAHFYTWYTQGLPYCGPLFEVRPAQEDIPGSIVAGFIHRYDKGAKVLGCPDGSNTVYRGAVWFDLSDIISKAPPLHVSVQSATLHFRPSGECPGELLIGTADWLKGYPEDTLVPGDLLATFPVGSLTSCPSIGCSVDAKNVVNNWVRGEEHGGYANYGFVFKGMREADVKYGDNDSCVARYGDFTLTVNYKYDKESPPPKNPPGKTRPGPGGPLETRKNYALTANGGTATASSKYNDNYPASAAINGEVLGIHKGSDPTTGSLWHSDSPTFPQWLEVTFAGGSKLINEIDVFTFQDNVDAPGSVDESTTFKSNIGLRQFEVQYWNAKFGWVNVPNGTFTAEKPNTFVWNKLKFDPGFQTTKIRVLTHGSGDGYSRIVELEAWGK